MPLISANCKNDQNAQQADFERKPPRFVSYRVAARVKMRAPRARHANKRYRRRDIYRQQRRHNAHRHAFNQRETAAHFKQRDGECEEKREGYTGLPQHIGEATSSDQFENSRDDEQRAASNAQSFHGVGCAEFVPTEGAYGKIDAPMKVTLALLAYNEADAIERTVRDAVAQMSRNFAPHQWEILVIEDGSRDATPTILARLAEENAALRVYTHAPNRGYVEATRSAIREARGEFVCVFDGDGQQTAADVPRFVQKLESGCDIVFGWKKQRFDPPMRLFLSRGLRLCARYFLRTRLHDINAGCRGFRRVHSATFLEIRHRINFIGPELYTRARLADLKIAEIVVKHAPREGGESSHPLAKIPREVIEVVAYLRALRAELRAAGHWRRFL